VLFHDLAQQLSAAPRLLMELGRLVRAPETDAREVVALLRRDASLVSRVIRIANSAAYARAEAVGSIEDAVVAVGFEEVHRVVGALASVQLSDQPLLLHGISPARYRENSLFVATLMEELAGRAGLDAPEGYTVGLMRALGKVVLERAALREEAHVPPFAGSGEDRVEAWQRRHWGIDGWQVTASVLRHWHFPADIIGAIEHHENPVGRPEPVVHLLQIAAACAAKDGYGLPGEHPRMDEETLAAAQLTADDFRAAVERAERTFLRLRSSVV
jgi:HD-like signal output (HDOD) protein